MYYITVNIILQRDGAVMTGIGGGRKLSAIFGSVLNSTACSNEAGSCGGAGSVGGDGNRPPSILTMVKNPGVMPRGSAVKRKKCLAPFKMIGFGKPPKSL